MKMMCNAKKRARCRGAALAIFLTVVVTPFPFLTLANDIKWIDEDVTVLPDTCAAPAAAGFRRGADTPDLKLVNVDIETDSGHLVLGRGNRDKSIEKMVIPFTQDVYATFLSDGSAAVSDLGWILYADAIDNAGHFIGWNSIAADKKHGIFHRIRDDSESFGAGDGVFDADYGRGGFPTDSEEALSVYDDGTGQLFAADGDARVAPHDMKKHLGRFAAGTEIVFYLTAGISWENAETSRVFFNRPWNPGPYDACIPDSGSPLWMEEGQGVFRKVFHLGDPAAAGVCRVENNWLAAPQLDRLHGLFGLNLSGETYMKIAVGTPYANFFGGCPADDANRIVFGVEDLNGPSGGADMDYNDLVFMVERLNGGTVELNPAGAVTPVQEDAFFTSAELNVCDVQPAGACAGHTALRYFLSPNNGVDWIEVVGWDSAQSFELDSEKAIVLGDSIDPVTWRPGVPPSTCRRRTVDLMDRGVTGNRMLWRIDMQSKRKDCTPEVVDMQLTASAALNQKIYRSPPVIQTNVIYSVSLEPPAGNWVDQDLRGHLTARRVYDAKEPNHTLRDEEPLWDAGRVLSTMHPDQRRIFFPDSDVRQVDGAYLTDEKGQRLHGDGVRVSFSGFLAHAPVQATTIRIADGRPEVFRDSAGSSLKGSFGGIGFIDHFTGRWEVTFDRPPAAGVPIKASYGWYAADRNLKPFTPANVTNDMLALTGEFIWPDGFTNDFNHDGAFDGTAGRTDAAWLVNLVRGYRQPEMGTKKEWLLGPVNHCTPALMIPPGFPDWLNGSAVTAAERESYAAFRRTYQTRPSVLFVGSGDGILHAFDAGAFRHGDNPDTPYIKENRGYFLWEEKRDTSPQYCQNYSGTKCPAYGTGSELWALIPAYQMPRLKNKLVSAGERAQISSSLLLEDVYIDCDGDGHADSWRTILIGASGSGGNSIFCLDVTDPDKPTWLWEIGAIDLFRAATSQPVVRIGHIRDPFTGKPRWVAFAATGRLRDSERFPAVYLIDVSGGSVLKRLTLDDAVDINADGTLEAAEAGYGRNGVLSGAPSVVDSDGNGFIDRLYVGSSNGLVYKVNIPDAPDAARDFNHCIVNSDFSDKDDLTVPMQQRYHGVFAAPAVAIEYDRETDGHAGRRMRIVFGTGEDLITNETVGSSNYRQHVFSYIDTTAKGDCDPDAHRLDWFRELEENHQVRSPIVAASGRLYLGTTTTAVNDPCAPLGEKDEDVGLLTVLDLEGIVYMSRKVGNVHFAPLIDDRHLYLQMPNGLQSFGSGFYNNTIKSCGMPEIIVQSWEEVK
jgi:hypothetical protein